MWGKFGLSTFVGLLTLTTVAAQPPYPRRVPPPIPRQEREYREQDRRRSWRYEKNGGGTYTHIRGRKWMEYRNSGEPIPFREVARTPDYVELYDEGRDLFARLYEDRCYVRYEGRDWTYWYDGNWE